MQLQVGHALKYTGGRPVYSLGEPWRLEVVAPRHWSPALDRFAREDTAGKVLFGTMWPSIP